MALACTVVFFIYRTLLYRLAAGNLIANKIALDRTRAMRVYGCFVLGLLCRRFIFHFLIPSFVSLTKRKATDPERFQLLPQRKKTQMN